MTLDEKDSPLPVVFTPEAAKLAIRLNRDASRCGYTYLKTGEFNSADTPKRRMLLQYFVQSQAHFDAVNELITYKKALSRSAYLQLRALLEGWLNMCLINSVDDNSWVEYLNHISAKERIKYARAIKSKNLNELTEDLKGHTSKIDFNQFDFLKFKPDINKPDKKPRNFYKNPLNLKEKCLILDSYTSDKKGVPYEDVYNGIYKALSSITHIEPYSNQSIFIVKDNTIDAQISGNPEEARLVLKFSFMYYANAMSILFHSYHQPPSRSYELISERFTKLYG